MMAASRGGNPDLTKGGVGYAALQGLQGGLQGLQLGKQMQDADIQRQQEARKKQMMDDYLMKLGLSPQAQASTGVLRPDIQQNGLSKLTPEQREIAKMAVMSGDWKTMAQMFGPMEPMKPTSVMQNAEAMGLRPGSPEYNSFVREAVLRPDTVVNMSGQIKAPTGYMVDPANPNRITKIPGLDFDQGQMKAAGYANRMVESSKKMGAISESGYDPANLSDKILGWLPGIGNFLKTKEGQTYTQAQEDWVRAKLRLESGAVIGDEEMAREISTYFPKAGDSDDVIAQKAEARQIAEENLIAESQGAYEHMLKGKKPKTQNVPAGVPPDVWTIMTPEERAAWQ